MGVGRADAGDGRQFSPGFMALMGVLTALIAALDYALPLDGTRKYGESKRGLWGAFIGMARPQPDRLKNKALKTLSLAVFSLVAERPPPA